MGPMKAAGGFLRSVLQHPQTAAVVCIRVDLFGSLAWTGRGHATDKAIVLGLSGYAPETTDPDDGDMRFADVKQSGLLPLSADRSIPFNLDRDIAFDLERMLPRHSNALIFSAFDVEGRKLLEETWYSVGGGFVVREGSETSSPASHAAIPYDYRSAAEILAHCDANVISIADLVLANETALQPESAVFEGIDRIVTAMFDCIDRGMGASGHLPGDLKVERRARSLSEQLNAAPRCNTRAPHEAMEYVNVYAIAVNEENAAGGRVVTAPTNGAAGVVPAVLKYYRDHCPGASAQGVRMFILAATAIGSLCKMNASISGAEVGCQGEVGSACSMAAAGLTAALGGTNRQIENAAEMGMEHHLGMTCDPIGGLVQIPCIERNAFGAVKAINAASLALRGDGTHRVTLDQVIETMRQTGEDMQSKYKETSRGGLAVNVPEC
jgi:L-serine dehydratase